MNLPSFHDFFFHFFFCFFFSVFCSLILEQNLIVSVFFESWLLKDGLFCVPVLGLYRFLFFCLSSLFSRFLFSFFLFFLVLDFFSAYVIVDWFGSLCCNLFVRNVWNRRNHWYLIAGPLSSSLRV